MITLELDKVHVFKPGEVVHLKVVSIYETSPGKWRLQVKDVTPLPGAEPTGYGCHGCGLIAEAVGDGGLPEKWVEKKFPTRTFFLCSECQRDVQICRVCGCSQEDACEGGCSWVEKDLCSSCVGKGPEQKTCPSGHTLPIAEFHSYVDLTVTGNNDDAVIFDCPGGKRGHQFTLRKAVAKKMFTAEEGAKIRESGKKLKESEAK